jgi:hypothetical protein
MKWGRGSMDWIHLARDRDRWRAVLNAAKKKTFGAHKMRGTSCSGEELLACQEGLCSMELVSWMLVSN